LQPAWLGVAVPGSIGLGPGEFALPFGWARLVQSSRVGRAVGRSRREIPAPAVRVQKRSRMVGLALRPESRPKPRRPSTRGQRARRWSLGEQSSRRRAGLVRPTGTQASAPRFPTSPAKSGALLSWGRPARRGPASTTTAHTAGRALRVPAPPHPSAPGRQRRLPPVGGAAWLRRRSPPRRAGCEGPTPGRSGPC
jgi:hypothetical protein